MSENPAAGTVPRPAADGAVAAEGVSDAVPPVFRRNDLVPLAVLALIGALAVTFSSSGFSQGLIGQWAILAIAGLGFYLAFGIGGQFTFAQAAFVGVGAYGASYLTQVHDVPFVPALLAGTFLAALVAALLFVLIRRCSAFYFAIATLAFAFLAVVVFRQWTAFSGPGGERTNLPGIGLLSEPLKGRPLVAFLVALVAVFLVLALLVERSPITRDATALRELPVATPTFGIDPTRIRFTMFVAGSAFGGAAGALMVHRTGVVQSELFDIPLAIDLFLVLFFGGLGSAWGPLLGAAFVVWAPEQLRFIGRDQELVFGILLILIMIFVPDGLVGIGSRLRQFLGRRPPAPPSVTG